MHRKNTTYWKSNLTIVISVLIVWFLVSFGFGIIWSEALDNIQIGGFKLGFWFAQQGSIFVFVIIIFIYVFLLNRLDKKHFSKSSEDD